MAAEASRASWNYLYEKGFLEILIEHKVDGRFATQNGWSTKGWNSIHRKFSEVFPLAHFTKAHLIDKNKDLKGTYRAIRDAMKESGAGLDLITGMVTGGPNVWEKIKKDHKKVVKFGKKGFPHYNSCKLLYEGSIATGDLSFTSTDPVLSHPPEHREVRVGQEASEAQAAPCHVVTTTVVAHAASSATVGATAASSSTMGDGAANIGGQEANEAQYAPYSRSVQVDEIGRKRKMKVSEKTMEAMEQKKCRAEEYSIENCLDTVNAMEELTDEENAVAAEVFESDLNREIFMMLKNLNVRLIWLRRKISRLLST